MIVNLFSYPSLEKKTKNPKEFFSFPNEKMQVWMVKQKKQAMKV